ncbi:MAG: glutamine-hydrolyzing carbamoyl-phosphate synthase small subunit [Wigglesworthia glossinidia]|nr:glutamine-hydrolyzing carbamoyl-phosphate synthase small subunit [Wigglesworthia glossinidia]
MAILILENGMKFYGKSIGSKGLVIGEIIFNTSMMGYQEVITDPSYFNQIVTFTYPHIGNVGINTEDNESSHVQVKAIVVNQSSLIISNFRNKLSLSQFLIKHNVIGISNIDTRRLTKLIRTRGKQFGCILSEKHISTATVQDKIKNFLKNQTTDLINQVTTKKKYIWNNMTENIRKKKFKRKFSLHIVAYDFGIKHSILKQLDSLNCQITVVPASTKANNVFALRPHGILLSNGPGNPEKYHSIIDNIRNLLKKDIPILGICLGHQLLAMSEGAKIFKMKFGHHGINHPVKDIQNNKIIITSQNHDFAIDPKTLSKNMIITHTSMFDGTLQGIQFTDKPVFSFQGHPESGPGPQDALFLFKKFIHLIKKTYIKI